MSAMGRSAGWSELEERYGIFLDPKRLKDEPAVVEGRFGQGKVILSLVHFDTPGDHNGATVLAQSLAISDYLIRDMPQCTQAVYPTENRIIADELPGM